MRVPFVSWFSVNSEERKEPVFQYKHDLKTLYKKGKFKKVIYDFYGEKLTKENCTLEHVKPISKFPSEKKKEATVYSNLVLATANTNQARGCRPLSEVLNWFNAGRYLEQFRDLVIKVRKGEYFVGNDYIQSILKTINTLLREEELERAAKELEERKLDVTV